LNIITFLLLTNVGPGSDGVFKISKVWNN